MHSHHAEELLVQDEYPLGLASGPGRVHDDGERVGRGRRGGELLRRLQAHVHHLVERQDLHTHTRTRANARSTRTGECKKHAYGRVQKSMSDW
jgi:hypothetical protein